jgi:predicted RNA binding protein YcfA (HicA-like mRNA interferase family)
MSHIPPIKTKKIIRLIQSYGWEERTKSSGTSHRCFVKANEARPIVLNDHHETPTFQIMQIIKHLKITREEFLIRISQV